MAALWVDQLCAKRVSVKFHPKRSIFKKLRVFVLTCTCLVVAEQQNYVYLHRSWKPFKLSKHLIPGTALTNVFRDLTSGIWPKVRYNVLLLLGLLGLNFDGSFRFVQPPEVSNCASCCPNCSSSRMTTRLAVSQKQTNNSYRFIMEHRQKCAFWCYSEFIETKGKKELDQLDQLEWKDLPFFFALQGKITRSDPPQLTLLEFLWNPSILPAGS